MSAAEGYQAIRRSRLVAILRASSPDRLVAGAQVLVEEDIQTLELPLTSPAALDAIRRTAELAGDRALVGAGTIRTVDDAREAVDAGARFLVLPALTLPVLEHAVAHDIAVLPGAMTPTEISTALAAGAQLVKLFPAVTLGARVLEAGPGPPARARRCSHGRDRARARPGVAGRRGGRPGRGLTPVRRGLGVRGRGPSAEADPVLEGCRLVTLDLITCGEAMGLVESERIGPLRLGGPMRMSMAGAESTVAIGFVRLGGSARWVGVVGDDEVGQLVRRTLSAEGVETGWKGLPTRAEVDLLRGADVLR